jgi:hypothetical protein
MKWKSSTVRTIPLLEAMMSNRVGQMRKDEGLVCTDMDPKLLYACLSFADTNYLSPAVLLTKLSKTIDVEDLLALLDYLGIEDKISKVSTVEELKVLKVRLKDIKRETLGRVARMHVPSGDIPHRDKARDAAVELCFSMARSCLDVTSNKTKSKLTTDVIFVVSHAKTFGPRLRTHVWKTFDRIVTLTPNQREKQFSKWTSNEALAFECNQENDSDDTSSVGCSDVTDGDCSDGYIEKYDEDSYFDGCYSD